VKTDPLFKVSRILGSTSTMDFMSAGKQVTKIDMIRWMMQFPDYCTLAPDGIVTG